MTYVNVEKPRFHKFENLDAMFPKSDCQAARETIESKSNDFNCVKVWGKYFSLRDVRNMITTHRLMEIKRDVEQEHEWFQQLGVNLGVPAVTCIPPNHAAVKNFERILLSGSEGRTTLTHSTFTEDLASLCCSRWVSLQAIDAFIPMINAFNTKRKVVLHGKYCATLGWTAASIQNRLSSEGHWSSELEQLSIVLNVTKDRNNNTIVTSASVRGTHWCLLHIDVATKSFRYMDSLGYPTPINLETSLALVLQAVSKLTGRKISFPSEIGRAHRSQCNRSRATCRNECSKNYPIQQCSSICGPATILMAALSAGAPKV